MFLVFFMCSFPYMNFTMFFSGCCLILMKLGLVKSHILSFLLVLEVFMLMNLYLLAMFTGGSFTAFSMLFAFFTCAVCEACVGVGVMIQTSRWKGNDKLSSLL